MNQVLETIYNRKSTRAYEQRPVPLEVRDEIIRAAMRAPTAGNMMLYSIIEVQDQDLKDQLVETCDNQPFIAQAPLVLLFLADYQRWFDYFHHAGVKEHLLEPDQELSTPQAGDLMLAACDALIAAQTAVLAAESQGLGSCYIGDILENYETHREMFDLPPYALPVALLCFGYPTEEERSRQKTSRFDEEFIRFNDRYRRLSDEDFERMYGQGASGQDSMGVLVYRRKYSAGFSIEMRRSVQAMLDGLAGE
jgi:FMN reductase (NADPH)/FMN reductase [NAD(P)H]